MCVCVCVCVRERERERERERGCFVWQQSVIELFNKAIFIYLMTH